ncbi:hypothetical protein DSL72_004713 [Monilinia vaccinii-corymbosi]|uniref:Uncharacterized protein n=1 Tax=Monilinia vaccinii-corymbosi TaxID=61207 RepID=A0A8A3NXF0_9HELO|nr:hypothetical protein DSL72_004713 [Monilinia vaccinii-corymbosi]
MRSTRRKASEAKIQEETTESRQISISFPPRLSLKSPSPLIITDPFLLSGIEAKPGSKRDGSGKGNVVAWKAKKLKPEDDSEGGGDTEDEFDAKDKLYEVPGVEIEDEKSFKAREGENSEVEGDGGDEANESDGKTQDEELEKADGGEKRGRGRPSRGNPGRKRSMNGDQQPSAIPLTIPKEESGGETKSSVPPKNAKKEFRQGTRSSARQQQMSEDFAEGKRKEVARGKETQAVVNEKRKNQEPDEDEDDEEMDEEDKPTAKKSKNEGPKELKEEKAKAKAKAKPKKSAKKGRK